MSGPGRFTLLLAALFGALLGLGGFTFHYSEGLSYFSSDPRACKNCHIMNAQYDSWLCGPHHTAAGCADCHLPHDFLPKYLAKAANGYHHSKAFTLLDFPEPIQIKPPNARILQENCLRCHAEFTSDIVHDAARRGDDVACVHCHRGAGHGARN